MKILMAQKWSWKSLTYSTFKLKNLSTGSVDMVSYNSLKNFLQLNEKFQNFRRKSHLCILVCFSTTRGKKSGFYYFAIFSSEQKWRTLLGFPSKFQIGKDLLPTLWTFIKRQGRWNSAHWWDVPIPSNFCKSRQQKNRITGTSLPRQIFDLPSFPIEVLYSALTYVLSWLSILESLYSAGRR